MLKTLENGWYCFGNGKKWRMSSPHYFCEIEHENNVPTYNKYTRIPSTIRRIKSFYSGRLKFGILDSYGTGLDIIVANAMTESLGTVPSPINYNDLEKLFYASNDDNIGQRLHEIILHISLQPNCKYLERREPGYINPVTTPNRVSLGSHHMLISTAISLLPNLQVSKNEKIKDMCLRLPSQSIFAAQLAIEYLNKYYSYHQNQLPLIAATYNAGKPRYTQSNPWNLVQYGNHIERWITYYNTSRNV